MRAQNQWMDRLGAGLILVAAITILTGTALSVPVWTGTIEEQDGWPVVLNPAEPMEQEEVIKPEQMWRIGADEEDTLFGLIEDALVDEDGNVLLLDTVLSTIYVVDQSGEIVRTVGREGDGPGEFRFAREMEFLPDGTIGVMEMMPGKIVVLDRDGTPRPSFALPDGDQGIMHHMQHISANDDAVLIGKVVTTFGDGSATTHYTLSSYAPDGTETATLLEHKDVQSDGNISLNLGGGDNEFTRRFTLCPDGRVIVFQKAKEYELEVFQATGAKQGIIRRGYESVRKSDKELEENRRQAEEMRERFQGSVELEIEEYARDISGVIARPGGEIWVINSQGDRDCPAQSVGLFDVFDQEGRYQRRVRIEADYDPDRDTFCLRGDQLFVFKEAQKAPPRISTTGGGGMVMMTISVGAPAEEEEDGEEPRPYEVICYRLSR